MCENRETQKRAITPVSKPDSFGPAAQVSAKAEGSKRNKRKSPRKMCRKVLTDEFLECTLLKVVRMNCNRRTCPVARQFVVVVKCTVYTIFGVEIGAIGIDQRRHQAEGRLRQFVRYLHLRAFVCSTPRGDCAEYLSNKLILARLLEIGVLDDMEVQKMQKFLIELHLVVGRRHQNQNSVNVSSKYLQMGHLLQKAMHHASIHTIPAPIPGSIKYRRQNA